jgi:hypothetical protein
MIKIIKAERQFMMIYNKKKNILDKIKIFNKKIQDLLRL